MKLTCVLLAVLTLVACEENEDRRAMKTPGQRMSRVFIIDAPTGRCVEVWGAGRYGVYFDVVELQKCARRDR